MSIKDQRSGVYVIRQGIDADTGKPVIELTLPDNPTAFTLSEALELIDLLATHVERMLGRIDPLIETMLRQLRKQI